METLICKITSKKFNDTQNKSGVITEHLKSISINVPSSYLRREYLRKNNIPWHYQFFNIIIEDEKESFKCKYCNWTTYDFENKSGCYTSHLEEKHEKTIEQYLNEYPDESVKFKMFLLNKKLEKEFEKEENYVICQICGTKVKYLTNTHLKKHKISQSDYKIKFGTKNFISENFKNKSREILVKATKDIKLSFVSKPEKSLRDFLINDVGVAIECNNRKLFGTEIDIISHVDKTCFEFDGNLYHSENYGKKKRFFHLNKTESCEKLGYRLIHIFEDEWNLKNDIVKSKIKYMFGLNNNKIYARKCVIKEIGSKEKNNFLNTNHIQGEDKSDIFLGAFYLNELVSVMTFDSKRKMSNHKNEEKNYELKRFATDINFSIIGIGGKLLSYFIKNYSPNKIISFADRRWTTNPDKNFYITIGFSLKNILLPDYSYYNSKIDKRRRFHKFGFGKKSIKKKYPEIYDNNKTEWQMMQEVGFDRIWDCGKFVYELVVN